MLLVCSDHTVTRMQVGFPFYQVLRFLFIIENLRFRGHGIVSNKLNTFHFNMNKNKCNFRMTNHFNRNSSNLLFRNNYYLRWIVDRAKV